MAEIRLPLITNDSFSPWAAQVHDTVRESGIIRSSDVNISSTPFGNFIGVRNEQKYQQLWGNYTGEYVVTSSYQVGDIVRVLPNKTYDYPWDDEPVKALVHGVPVLNGTIDGTPFNVPNYIAVPGTYICTYPIAPLWFMLDTFWRVGVAWTLEAQGALASQPAYIQTNVTYLRFVDVNYFPVYPELPAQAFLNPSNLSSLKGRYWDCLSLAPTRQRRCVNGNTITTYVDAEQIPSGSANYVPPD